MCCCKLHLHTGWSIKALIQCCNLQSIDLGQVKDYYSFFSYLASDCEKESTTHISWNCSSNKNQLCQHMQLKWDQLVSSLKESSDSTTTVSLLHFEKMLHKKKNGQFVDRLKAVKEDGRRGVVVITTAQFHSTKPELRFCTGSNPAHSVLEIRDGENL